MKTAKGFITAAALVALFSLLVSCQKEADDSADATKDTMQNASVMIDSAISTDSVPIYYEVHGSGEPALVFAHGWGINGGFFNHQIEAFDDSFTVIVMDLAGHGRSGHNRTGWGTSKYAADINAVLDAAQVNQAVLFGHSMSGVFVAAAAAAKPERILGVVGIDTYQSFRESYPRAQVDSFLAPFRVDFDSAVAEFAWMMLPKTTDTAVANRIIAEFRRGDQEPLIETLDSLLSTDASSIFASLQVPARAINADTYPTQVDSNRTLVPSFDVKIMQGVGHFPFIERPEEFNRLVRETVAELQAGK